MFWYERMSKTFLTANNWFIQLLAKAASGLQTIFLDLHFFKQILELYDFTYNKAVFESWAKPKKSIFFVENFMSTRWLHQKPKTTRRLHLSQNWIKIRKKKFSAKLWIIDLSLSHLKQIFYKINIKIWNKEEINEWICALKIAFLLTLCIFFIFHLKFINKSIEKKLSVFVVFISHCEYVWNKNWNKKLIDNRKIIKIIWKLFNSALGLFTCFVQWIYVKQSKISNKIQSQQFICNNNIRNFNYQVITTTILHNIISLWLYSVNKCLHSW